MYPLTLAVEVVLVILALATLDLSAEAFGTTGFGEFAVARRAVSVLAVPLLLGMGIALTRHVAYDRASAGRSLVAAVAIVIPVLVSFGVVFTALSGPMSAAFFGSSDLAHLILPTAVAIGGIALHAVAYSYHTGHLRMWASNALQLIDVGIAPLAAVLLSGGSVERALLTLGVISIVVSSVALAPAIVVALDAARGRTRTAARELVRYGVPRVPGDLAHFALFSVPTIVVAHRAGIEAAGFLSFGLSLVHLIDAPFAVGRTLLLPMVSALAAAGETERIRRLIRRALVVTASTAAVSVFVAELVLEPAVDLLLGPAFADAARASRWLVLGAVPYAVYSVLRGAVDGLAVWPHNSINLVVALAVLCALLAPGAVAAEVAVPLAFIALAALTLRSTWSSLRPNTAPLDLASAPRPIPE